MYYLYQHIRLDKNEVFYIGIGTKSSESTLKRSGRTHKAIYRRAYEKTKSRNQYWKNIIKLTPYRVDIIYETDNIEEIIQKEVEYINLYKASLCNLTDGGYGINSYNHSEETKLKISQSLKGKKKSKEHCVNINKRKSKPIIMYNNIDTLQFDSLKAAAEYLGNSKYIKNISACLNGKRPSAYGYKFKSVESKDKEP